MVENLRRNDYGVISALYEKEATEERYHCESQGVSTAHMEQA